VPRHAIEELERLEVVHASGSNILDEFAPISDVADVV
jgi:hypothetical protein